MKRRCDIPLAEVLAVIDERISVVRDQQKQLREQRSANEPLGWRDRKSRELRLARIQLEGLRRSISNLRYGPLRDSRGEWARFVQAVCRPVI